MTVSFLPGRQWTVALLVRASMFWLGARGIVAILLLRAELDPIELSYAQATWLIAAVAFLVWWETRRRGELLLLANLGHSHVPVLLLGTIPALLMEVLVAIGVRQ
jgi:hypothetical protein